MRCHTSPQAVKPQVATAYIVLNVAQVPLAHAPLPVVAIAAPFSSADTRLATFCIHSCDEIDACIDFAPLKSCKAFNRLLGVAGPRPFQQSMPRAACACS